MTLKKDFEFISDLADEFFRRSHVKSTLIDIDKSAMTGWEKWLQIELASFLCSHVGVRAWWRESKYELDRRVIDSRKTCAVDFLVREKNKQSHIALELKQVNAPNGCIKGMLTDKKKIASIKYAKFDIRSVWCLGVHKLEEPSEVRRLTNYHADKMDTAIKAELFLSKAIGKTKYAYTIF